MSGRMRVRKVSPLLQFSIEQKLFRMCPRCGFSFLMDLRRCPKCGQSFLKDGVLDAGTVHESAGDQGR